MNDLPELSDKYCLICSEKSDGIHFNVVACRACAAFFRRSVVMRKKYVCREGKDSCNVSTTAGRHMCRKCRLRKCLDSGMKNSSVQGCRDPIIPKSEDMEPLSACGPSKYSTEKETLSACTSFSVPDINNFRTPNTLTNGIIANIGENYRTLRSVRRSAELAMHGCTKETMFSDNKQSLQFSGFWFLVTYKKGVQAKEVQWPILVNFMRETFPEICDMNAKNRLTVLTHANMVFLTLDMDYITTENFAFEELDTMTMVSETLYAETGSSLMEGFLDGSPINLPTEQFWSLMGPYGLKRFKETKNIAEQNLQKEEYYALLGLTLWSETMFGINDEIIAFAKPIRKRIHEDLHQLYTFNGNTDYAERMGSLLFLMNSAIGRIEKEREMIELMNIIIIPRKDNFFVDLMRHRIDMESDFI